MSLTKLFRDSELRVSTMKKLGVALHIAKTGRLVAKIDNPKVVPRIGSVVYNSSMEKIGVVTDIIGPVAQPYALIKLSSKDVDSSKIIGKSLYFEVKKPKPKRKRGARKKQTR